MDWMNNVAVSVGGDLLMDFVKIDGLKKEQAKFEWFGEEIRAHQFLENELKMLGIQNTEYILDAFNTELRSEYELSRDNCTLSRACADCTQYGQRPSVTDDITMYNNTNIDCVQGSQQDMLVREVVASLHMEKQPSTEDTENIISMGTGLLCPGGSKYTKNDINTIVIQAEGTRCSPTHSKNMFTQYEQQLQEEDKVVAKKYDAVLDIDMQESRNAWSRNVGPGIASKMKLLFNAEEGDDQEVVHKDVSIVEMNQEEEVVIKRRKRNGQRREEGVRVAKLDGWLQRGEGSQVLGKRKHFEGEVSESKRRMFGK